MELKELFDFIEMESKRLNKHYGVSDNEKMILARTVKLSEEVGELCNEVLMFNSLQRKQKLDEHNKESIGEEFADVVIVALLLAEVMGIDVERALEKKVEKINKRYEE